MSTDGTFNFLPENIPGTGLLTIEDSSGNINNISFEVDENGNISNVQIEVDGEYIPMYQEFFAAGQNNLQITHIEDVCEYR